MIINEYFLNYRSMQPYKYLHCKMEAGFSTLGEDYFEVLAKYVMAIVTGGNVMEEEPEPGWVGYTVCWISANCLVSGLS